jgi:hypothetical protein
MGEVYATRHDEPADLLGLGDRPAGYFVAA